MILTNLQIRWICYTKNIDINLCVRDTFLWNNLHQLRSKPNNMKAFGNKKTKDPKPDGQNNYR